MDTQEQSGWLLWHFYFELPPYQFPQCLIWLLSFPGNLALALLSADHSGGACHVPSCGGDPRNLRSLPLEGGLPQACRHCNALSSVSYFPFLPHIPSPLRPLVTNAVHITCPKKYFQRHFLMWPFSSQETSRSFLLLTTPVGS